MALPAREFADLSAVLRASLKLMELDLSNLSGQKAYGFFFPIRKKFAHILVKTRVIVARLLVLFRAQKFYQQNAHFLAQTEKDQLEIVILKLRKMHPLISNERLSSEMLFNTKMIMRNYIIKCKKPTNDVMSLPVASLFQYKIPMHLKFRIYKGSFLLLADPKRFSLLIKIHQDGYCDVKRVRFFWPPAVLPSSGTIQSLIKLMTPFNCRDGLAIYKLNRIATNFCLSSEYIYIVAQLQKIVGQFNATIIKINGLAEIFFSDEFIASTSFRLEIIAGDVFLTSTNPVLIPPKDIIFQETVNERVSQLTTLSFCRDKIFFTKKVNLTMSFVELMLEMRNIVFYTSFNNLWSRIAMCVVESLPFRLPCSFNCSGPLITHSFITIGNADWTFCSIKQDAATGKITYEHSLKEMIPDPSDFTKLINTLLTSTQIDTMSNYFFLRPRALSTTASLLIFGEYRFITSFSSNYFIRLITKNRMPELSICSNDGQHVRYTAKLIEFLNLSPRSTHSVFDKLLKDIKIHLIILQLIHIIETMGYKTYELSDGFYTFAPSYFFFKFKLSDASFWQIEVIHPPHNYFAIFDPIRIMGTSISARFCDQIIDLFTGILSYFIIYAQLNSCQELETVITDICKETQLYSKVTYSDSNKLYFGFNFLDYYEGVKGYLAFFHPFIAARPVFKFLTNSIPSFNYAFSDVRITYSIGTFIRGALPVIVELVKAFSQNPNWVIIINIFRSEMLFVFVKKMTLAIQVKPKRSLACRFLSHGPSSFFVHSLSQAGVRMTERNGSFYFSAKVPQLISFKMRLEKMQFIYEPLRSVEINNFMSTNEMLIGKSDNGNVSISIGQNSIFIELKFSEKATLLSKKISQTATSMPVQLILTKFFYRLLQFPYCNTVLSILLALPESELNWAVLVKKVKLAADKALLVLVNKSQDKEIVIQIIVMSGIIATVDLKKQMGEAEALRYINSQSNKFAALHNIFN